MPSIPEKYPTTEDRAVIISELRKNLKIKSDDVDRLMISEDFYRALDIVLSRTVSQLDRVALIKDLQLQLPAYREMISIACFSETNMSNLMWAHYADNYSGFCIEYDFQKNRDDKIAAQTVKVHYSDIMPRKEDGIPEDEYTRRVLFTKSSEWSYEKEWRFVDFQEYAWFKNGIYHILFMKPSIENVYLGCRINPEIRQEIIDYYAESKVQVYDMRLSNERYEFDFEKVG